MDNDKTKATETSAAASEPLVLRPEWEYKPKDLDEPKQSKLIMFPASLEHYVEGHTADEDRVSIAFNTKLDYE